MRWAAGCPSPRRPEPGARIGKAPPAEQLSRLLQLSQLRPLASPPSAAAAPQACVDGRSSPILLVKRAASPRGVPGVAMTLLKCRWCWKRCRPIQAVEQSHGRETGADGEAFLDLGSGRLRCVRRSHVRLACLCQGVELGAQRQASEGSRQRPWGLGRSGAPRNSKVGCVASQGKRWKELEVLNAAPCVSWPARDGSAKSCARAQCRGCRRAIPSSTGSFKVHTGGTGHL